MKSNIFLKNVISLYCMLFFLLLAAGSESSPPPKPLVEASDTAKIIALGSFFVSVIGFIIALFNKDDNKRKIAGIGGVLFLIVSIIILLSHIKS